MINKETQETLACIWQLLVADTTLFISVVTRKRCFHSSIASNCYRYNENQMRCSRYLIGEKHKNLIYDRILLHVTSLNNYE